jgi:hypothetical protein
VALRVGGRFHGSAGIEEKSGGQAADDLVDAGADRLDGGGYDGGAAAGDQPPCFSWLVESSNDEGIRTR